MPRGSGLRVQVPDALKEVYLSIGIDLEESNGSPDWTLPVPARIVVDRTGIVRAADIDVDYTRRPEPEKDDRGRRCARLNFATPAL